jgi:hypothetical protein
MTGRQQYRVLAADGQLSSDVFSMSPEQPGTIKAGCLLMVHEPSGRTLTVHETRVFPAGLPSVATIVGESKRACLTCGKVQGVVQDQVACPNDGGPCGLVEPSNRNDGEPLLASR